MALWQRDFFAVSSQKLCEIYGTIPAQLSDEEFNKRRWWEGAIASAPDRREIEKLLPPLKITDGLEIYGSDSGHRIQAVFGDDKKTIVELLVRISETEAHTDFVQQVVNLCIEHKFVFVSAETGRVATDYKTLIEELA